MSKIKYIIISLLLYSVTAFSQLGLGCSTSSEQIMKYDNKMLTYRVKQNNLYNEMTWTDAWSMHSLAGMYNVTNDMTYLKKMIELVDEFEEKKNNTETGMVDHYMDVRPPSWLSYIKKKDPTTGKQTKGPEVYTNVVQTSMLLLPIVTCAKTIFSHPELLNKKIRGGKFTGSTYGEKAQYYITSSLESVNFFIDRGWLNPETYLLQDRSVRFDEYDAVTNPIEPLAFNRMFNMGRVMKELAIACELTQKEEYKDYIALTDKMLTAMVAYLKEHISVEEKDGVNQYFWYYKERAYGKLIYEDIGHLGLDIDCLHYFYTIDKDHYGLTKADFQAISNTVLHTIYSKEENGFYDLMNGSGKISEKGFQSFVQLSYYSPEIQDLICEYSYENQRKFLPYRFVQLVELNHHLEQAK